MAGEKHLYMVVRGSYNDPDLSEEMWQWGIRFAGVFGSVDSIGNLPTNWTPVAANESRSTTFGSVETSFRVSGPVGASFSPDDWLQDRAVDAVKAFHIAKDPSNIGINNRATLDEIRLYVIGDDGHVVYTQAGAARATAYLSPVVPGGGPGEMSPPQTAIAVTLRTNDFSRTGRGRFYVPAIDKGNVGSDGLLTTAAQDHFVQRADALITTLRASLPNQDLTMAPAVVGGPSKRNLAGWNKYAAVTGVEVGSVPDQQRRRRNRIRETYRYRSTTD